MTDQDKSFMRQCIELAKTSYDEGEGAFGCVIVDNRTGEIIAKGRNHSSMDPLWHGETDAIHKAAELYTSQGKCLYNFTKNMTLYSSCEPCAMCMGCILWSGFSRLVFGTYLSDLEERGWKMISQPCVALKDKSWCRNTMEITGGVLREEANALQNGEIPHWAKND